MTVTVHGIKVLDSGYVNLVERWGSYVRTIEAARMSTQKGFEGWGPLCSNCGHGFCEETGFCDMYPHNCNNGKAVPGDEKLLAYMYKNKHMTPFEMAGAVFEIQAPIFVFREWHRHRTQSYNEASARYAPLPDLNYVPSVERLMLNSKTNKQAGTIKDAELLTEKEAEWFREALSLQYEHQEQVYQNALKRGVPKELARCVLPVGRYSRMRASANLRNWMQFLELRDESHAQWEIREYARVVHSELRKLFPRTFALYDEAHRE